jgi:DNA-binding CsgD family transcriptional regulator
MHLQRDLVSARRVLKDAPMLARQLGDQREIARVHLILGRLAYFDNDAETARALGEQSLAAAREVGDEWIEGWALHLLALAAYIAGDYTAARRLYGESLVVRHDIQDHSSIAVVMALLAMVDYSEGDYIVALRRCREALKIQRELGARWLHANLMAEFASIAFALGQLERAVRLSGGVATISEAVSGGPIPIVDAVYRPALTTMRRTLGDERFAAEQEAGRRLSMDEIITEALAIEVPAETSETQAAAMSPPDSGRAIPRFPDGLSAREAEVLRLMAAGASTREIADRLVISTHTVERHITHVYQKTGCRNRAEATAYAHRHGLA